MLSNNGIIYVANGSCIYPIFLTNSNLSLKVDWELTQLADYNSVCSAWWPKVLRKTN